ncbi:MAG: TRAP transporter large permease subunit [Rhodospirillaceae bacterium]|nr:TRAP transporter large permease subunit [Rhodospirillaceae bacterium]
MSEAPQPAPAAATAPAGAVVPERNEGHIRTPLDAAISQSGYVIGWLIFFAMVFTVYEVILRYIFNDPTYWVHETTVFLVATIFSLGGPVVLASDRHIRVRLVYDLVSDRTRDWLDIFNTIITFVFCVGLTFAAYIMFTRSAINPAGEWQLERSGTSWNPPFPSLTKAMILLAAGIMTVQSTWHMVQAVVRMPRPIGVVLALAVAIGGYYAYAWLEAGGLDLLMRPGGLGLNQLGIDVGTYVLIGSIFLMLPSGMPLAFITGLVALVFTFGWFGASALPLVTARVYGFVTEYSLVAVPMFVFMASLLDRSAIARDLFSAMRIFAGRLPGGVGVQTLVVAFFMAAMSGIIGGEIVLLGLLALPQMLRLGYSRNIAIGVVCAGGSLGTMVPPSIVLIIYGLMASVSIADLFLAAVTPAVILMLSYMAYVLVRCFRNPELGPPLTAEEAKIPLEERLKAAWSILQPATIAFIVLGSIYGGVASVTEAASMGVLATLAIILLRGEFSPKLMQQAVTQTLNTCGMIIWIGVGAAILVGVYNLMGGNRFVSAALLGIDAHPIFVIMLMMGILLVLGLFLDWIGIALLTLPIFVPIVVALDYDPIWFGVLFAVNMQVSFLSPPFGPAAFYLKGVAPKEISLTDIFGALLPFIAIQICVLALMLSFPGLSLWILG